MASKTTSRQPARARRVRRKSPLWWKITKIVFSVCLCLFLIGTITLTLMFVRAYQKADKQIADLNSKIDTIEAKQTEIVAADGKTPLYTAAAKYRRLIESYDEIPKNVINATLAAEDKRFFEHEGVDFVAAVRSVVVNVMAHDTKQGGSTITMQLCKRLFTSPKQTFERKLNDAALALQMENQISKQEILRVYLNEVFYGENAYGIKAAAEVYFHKSLKQLTIAEAAMLARCVRVPSKQNPFTNLKIATENRDVVLRIMRDENMITQTEYDHALKEPIKLAKYQKGGGSRVLNYPYFTTYVLDWLRENCPDLDLDSGGYRIETTLDPKMQEAVQEECRKLVRRQKGNLVTTAAFVLLKSDGSILGMAGGVDFARNQFNIAYQGGRQPGSSFKPYVYSTGLSTGAITPTDRISNEFLDWDGYKPHNSGGGYGGTYAIPDALAQSKNVPAVRVTEMTGMQVVSDYCKSVFGFHSQIRPVRSMALGTNEITLLEQAEGYSVFQLKGDRFTPFPVTRILDSDNRVIRTFGPDIKKQMLDPSVASYMDKCLRYVVTNGTGHEAQSIADAHGKTGTTQENCDAWFCGYTNNLLGIGWISNEIKRGNRWVYRPMSSYVMGGTVTVDLWRGVMQRAQAKYGRGGDRKEVPILSADIPLNVTGEKPKKNEKIEQPPVEPPVDQGAPTEEDGGSKPPADNPTGDTPPKTTPKQDPKTTDPADSEQFVTIDVCADTGLRATAYCPETYTRTVRKNRLPRYCTRHRPPPE